MEISRTCWHSKLVELLCFILWNFPKFWSSLATNQLLLETPKLYLADQPWLTPQCFRLIRGRFLVNFFKFFYQYCGHIRRRDGLTGLWRGVSPRLVNVVVQHFAEKKLNEVEDEFCCRDENDFNTLVISSGRRRGWRGHEHGAEAGEVVEDNHERHCV